MNMNNSVRAYLRRIGGKGGRAGKGTKLRSELNRRAAHIRWHPATGSEAGQNKNASEHSETAAK